MTRDLSREPCGYRHGQSGLEKRKLRDTLQSRDAALLAVPQGFSSPDRLSRAGLKLSGLLLQLSYFTETPDFIWPCPASPLISSAYFFPENRTAVSSLLPLELFLTSAAS